MFEERMDSPQLVDTDQNYLEEYKLENIDLSQEDLEYLHSLNSRIRKSNEENNSKERQGLDHADLITDTGINVYVQSSSGKYPNNLTPTTQYPNGPLSSNNYNFTSQYTQNPNPKMTKKDLVYEKLSKTSKPYYIEVARLIQEVEERKKCPFKPQVNQEGRRYSNLQELFEHLHDESIFKSELTAHREDIRRKKEMQGCTFTPKRSVANSQVLSPQNIKQGPDIHQKLFNDHTEIQKRKMWMIQAKEKALNESLKFTPQLVSKSISRVFQDNPEQINQQLTLKNKQSRFERLYQDSKLKKEKSEKIKQNRDQEIVNLRNQSRNNRVSLSKTRETEVKENQEPRYMTLFQQSKNQLKKAQELEVKVYSERGITFAPTRFSTSFIKSPKNLQIKPVLSLSKTRNSFSGARTTSGNKSATSTNGRMQQLQASSSFVQMGQTIQVEKPKGAVIKGPSKTVKFAVHKFPKPPKPK